MSYYSYLKYRYDDIFERDCSLIYIDITNELFDNVNLSYEKFRNNILKMIDNNYSKLNNHCYLAINIESIKRDNISYQWNLYADIVLYCEKFKEINLKTGYFKPEVICNKTSNYIKELDKDIAKFEISNEGYSYKDCFIIPKNLLKFSFDNFFIASIVISFDINSNLFIIFLKSFSLLIFSRNSVSKIKISLLSNENLSKFLNRWTSRCFYKSRQYRRIKRNIRFK